MEQQSSSSDIQAVENQEKNTVVAKRKSRWRWLWYSLFLLLFMLITPLVFLATGTGQRLALQWLDKAMDSLSIEQVEGSLQEGLSLTNTQFQMEGVSLQLGRTDLHIGFRCLLDRKACIENVALKDSVIAIDTHKLPPSQPKSEAPSTGEFRLPLPVSLNNVSLDNIQVQVDEMAIQLDHFHTGLQGEGNHIALAPTALDGLRLSLPATQAATSEPKIAKTEKREAKQAVDWDALKQQLAEPLLTKIDPIKLPLNFAIPDFSAKNIEVSQPVKNAKPKSLVKVFSVLLTGKSDSQSVELKNLDIQTDKGNIVGQGLLTLDANYPLAWQLKANSPALPEFKLPASQVDLTLSGELFGKTALAINTSGAAAVKIEGSVQLAEPKTPLDLQIQSQAIRYPFIAEKGVDPLKLKNLNLALSGNLLNYQLNGGVAMSGMGVPSGNVSLQGEGELTQFKLTQLTLNALQGKAILSGKVYWHEGVEWQSNVNLNKINTKSLTPEWVAILSGNLHTTGFAGRGEQGEKWAVSVSEMDLSGNLFNKQLQLKGSLNADHQTLLNVPSATLIYGENNIALKGVLGEKSDLQAVIKAPNLQGLVPNLRASVNGNVVLKGKISEPEVDLDLVANNVSYADTRLQNLTAKGKITTDQEIQGNLTLGVRQFSHGDIRLDNANLIATGSEKNHNLRLTSQGDPVGANLQISGSFDRLQQRWQGQLSNVAVQSPVGEFRNDKAIAVNYRHQAIQADISAHCWRSPNLNLCFPQAFRAGKEGKVSFEINKLDLALVQDFLEKESQISGTLSAKGEAAWFENRSPAVDIEVTSNGIKFVQKIDYRSLPITLKPVKLNANFADNNLKLNTDIRLENNGRLVSELQMKDVAKTRTLSGNLNIEKLSLNLIKPLLSNNENVAGELNARLTLGGNALSPLLFGNLNLTGLQARSTAMPFDVTGGQLALNFNGASSTLKGNVQTKESNLLLEGDANWQKLDAWYTRIQAQANRFRVNVPNIAKVDVSPNIEVKATPQLLLLSGNVDVPWARIAVEELPESAVSVSSDEVIMDGSSKDRAALPLPKLAKDKQGMAVKADITINIGQDRKEAVKIDAYGFKSDLRGILKVRQGERGLGLFGQVNLRNGTFASFGQDLVVRKGLISFTGTPSQPTLDVEAIRNPEAMEDPNIIAGVKVSGIADNPDVKVFSNPSMPQDQALSYILTGRSLENSGDGSSGNSIAAALIGMSLSKSSKLVGGIGSTFGITDLNVTTAGIGDNTKVVVSGSLTPKFKVKYGVGLFAPLTELTLRYRLAPSLYLQWMSSINQAVDLMYRFEFD